VARAGPVTLKIYGVDGRLVATVVDGNLEAGRYDRVWQGVDQQGRALASGAYLMRLEAGDGVHSRRLTLLR
jgi:flagellar hook assembly protein FlgD